MAKMNLLTIVQSVLNSMTADNVNSIDDTPLSSQVALEAKNVFYELIESRSQGWPHLRIETRLEGLGDTTKPTHMRIPEAVSEVYFLKYDVSKTGDSYTTIRDTKYLHPKDFLDHVYDRNSSNSNVETVTTSEGVKLFIINDAAPTYWTSFDDEYIIFDSFDNTVDTTLQGSKSVIGAYRQPSWTHSDTFTPDLPSDIFPLYLAELTNVSHIYFNQQQSIVDTKRVLRQRALQNNDSRANGERKYNFGRK